MSERILEMDADQFDRFIQSLAAGGSRRSFLRGGIAAVLASTGLRRIVQGVACTPPGNILATSACNSDAECCFDGVCVNGLCRCPHRHEALCWNLRAEQPQLQQLSSRMAALQRRLHECAKRPIQLRQLRSSMPGKQHVFAWALLPQGQDLVQRRLHHDEPVHMNRMQTATL